MPVSCVYWVRCADHTDLFTQGYIGVTSNFDRRMNEHYKKTENRHFKFAIEKYGWENLIKEQILIGSEDYCLEIEQKLRPTDKIGWNLVKGGGNPPPAYGNNYKSGIPSWNKGIPMAEESAKKLSQSIKKLWEDPEYKQRMSNALKGRTSPMKGRKQSPESIEKNRQAKLGKPSKKKGILLSEEQKARLSWLVRQNPWECPHCKKIGYSVGARNRWHFDNCKLKLTAEPADQDVILEGSSPCL